ncbi:hypothetical protein ACWCRB_36940, partial [Streptomyces sp. NPDC002156]
MHDSHHELPIGQKEMTTAAPDGASWRSGHSPAGGAPEPDPAPGVAGSVHTTPSAERQRRRWATQVDVADVLA